MSLSPTSNLDKFKTLMDNPDSFDQAFECAQYSDNNNKVGNSFNHKDDANNNNMGVTKEETLFVVG